MLTSEAPFDANSPSELLRKIQKEKINLAPFSVFYNNGELVKDFISKCLEKDPKNRPSAKELCHHEWISIMQREDMIESENRYQMVHDLGIFKEATTF